MADPLDPVPITALQHWSYCQRQCALIHQEQAFAENLHTARGQAVHTRVDTPGFATRGDARSVRALPLFCDRLGMAGKADVVEFLADGTPYPIEYKHGPRRQHLHDDIQLAAQALCLEEMTGKSVRRGAIYHASSHRRREVMITEELRREVAQTGLLPCAACWTPARCLPRSTTNAATSVPCSTCANRRQSPLRNDWRCCVTNCS